ncbi:hypothetical protein ACIRRA_12540 [Nocardia sp. NPDC101769]
MILGRPPAGRRALGRSGRIIVDVFLVRGVRHDAVDPGQQY